MESGLEIETAIATLLPYAMPLMDKTQQEGYELPLRAGNPTSLFCGCCPFLERTETTFQLMNSPKR